VAMTNFRTDNGENNLKPVAKEGGKHWEHSALLLMTSYLHSELERQGFREAAHYLRAAKDSLLSA